MKIITKIQDKIVANSIIDKYVDSKTIFIDIETTGFSPKYSNIYLIGCIIRENNHLKAYQFFSENFNEEGKILEEFAKLISNYNKIVTFNGISFDIPFIKSKFEQYDVICNLNKIENIDIFKEISSLKFLFNLNDYKQKTLEKFLEINRNDNLSGGDLIKLYKDFVKTQNQNTLELILLHNYEDIIFMPKLLSILSYRDIINGNFILEEIKENHYTDINNTDKKEIIFVLKNYFPVPKSISKQKDSFYYKFDNDITQIRVPILSTSLKYFYPNYKDYYYIKSEDMAVHKSVGEFVDKENREKCHAHNCYTIRTGEFIPQPATIFTPEFKEDYKNKLSFFQYKNSIFEQIDLVNKYINSILKNINK